VAAFELTSLFTGFLKLALLTVVVLYAGLVLMSYGTDGSRERPRFDLRDPATSAERILTWLGVVTLAWCVRGAARTFAMLTEESAVVGEWFLRRHAPETLASFHTRPRE